MATEEQTNFGEEDLKAYHDKEHSLNKYTNNNECENKWIRSINKKLELIDQNLKSKTVNFPDAAAGSHLHVGSADML